MEIICPACHTHYTVLPGLPRHAPKFCPFCKAPISLSDATTIPADGTSFGGSVSMVPGHEPEKEKIQFTIGSYQIIDSIGKGGMGEVFLAYDTTCGRRIALKRIRPDLIKHTQLHKRFLKEARITSQLTHPAIIPIYSIQGEDGLAYYTMPYVEGQTLKQIIAHAKKLDRKLLKQDHLSSIPALVRIFLSVCQAIAYAHSKHVIHRDLKPNNIIVGQYGEVLILDWGLAKLLSQEAEAAEELDLPEQEIMEEHDLTHTGKAVGTVAYMAPERALGQPANFQTDIYSLGVILYQILTLHHPFHRHSLQDFRKNMDKEVLYDPAELAPYRDVPPILSQIVLKCLSPSVEDRYTSVNELINALESYLEGRSEWFKMAELDVRNKSDWEFQENVLIAEHMAITRGTEISDWVSLMISQESFQGNTKLEAKVLIGLQGHGVGFLMSVPDTNERVHLNNGYCLWIGSDLNKTTKLLRSTVEVVYSPDVFLQRNEWYQVRIEKLDDSIYFYLNDVLQFSYISHLPLSGAHVGLLSRDADFEVQDFFVFSGSQNITVKCLAVPDAFLAHKFYGAALQEYRRIGQSFPGTAEGREAMFRAGITLLEEARNTRDPEESLQKSEEALEEFGKLHGTPGAPLEYLGKSLVYQSLGDYEEEIKCFELAFRRYPRHPLLPILQEQLIHRMHDTSRYHRKATYHFILLAVRFLPASVTNSHIKKLFDSLKKHWEPLYFLDEELVSTLPEQLQNVNFSIQLAFWLAKKHTLSEIIDEQGKTPAPHIPTICHALFALVELGAWETAQEKLQQFQQQNHDLELIQTIILSHQDSIQSALAALFAFLPQDLGTPQVRSILYLMYEAIRQHQPNLVHEITARLAPFTISDQHRLAIDCNNIWAYLLERNWAKADELLHKYSLEQLTQETTPLHFLYGCWLYITEGMEIASIHFASILQVAYPRSWTLFSHFINSRNEEQQVWLQKAFLWEKRQLYKQFALFYHCANDLDKAREYEALEAAEYTP